MTISVTSFSQTSATNKETIKLSFVRGRAESHESHISWLHSGKQIIYVGFNRKERKKREAVEQNVVGLLEISALTIIDDCRFAL